MRERRDDRASHALRTRRPPTPVDEDVDRTSIDVKHVCDTRTTRRGDAWRVAKRHDVDKMLQFGDALLRLNPGRAPSSPRASILLVFTRDVFVFVRIIAQRRAKGPNSVLRVEMARVPGIFLVRTNFFGTTLFAHTKCLVHWYTGTLVHWYSTRAVPGRSVLLGDTTDSISRFAPIHHSLQVALRVLLRGQTRKRSTSSMPARRTRRRLRTKVNVLCSRCTVLLLVLVSGTYSIGVLVSPKQNTGVGRPIMQLSTPPHKGLYNQVSTILTGLYLATLLGWDILLPEVYSPTNCGDMSPKCYDYSTFQAFRFSLFFDQEFFTDFIEREYGLHVYKDVTDIPDSYVHMGARKSPCARGCRSTYDGLYRLYSTIDYAAIVHPPGIAAAIVDSDKHAEGLLLAMSALRESPIIRANVREQVLSLRARNAILVAVHWRFESDVSAKSEQLSNESIFHDRLLEELGQFTATNLSHAAIFFVGGHSATAHRNYGLRVLKLDEIPAHEYRESEMHKNITFIQSAIHHALAREADLFVGHGWSSFSAFAAMWRFRHRLPSKLIPSQAVYNCDLLERHDALTHWQYELTLPLQDCVVQDPCLTLYEAKLKRPPMNGYTQLKFGCPYERERRVRTRYGTGICTGMTQLRQRCSRKPPLPVLSSY